MWERLRKLRKKYRTRNCVNPKRECKNEIDPHFGDLIDKEFKQINMTNVDVLVYDCEKQTEVNICSLFDVRGNCLDIPSMFMDKSELGGVETRYEFPDEAVDIKVHPHSHLWILLNLNCMYVEFLNSALNRNMKIKNDKESFFKFICEILI